MQRRLFALGLAPLAMLVECAFACGEPSHIFEGRLFVEERECLGTKSSVDVVEGDTPAECGPTCLAQPLADGGRSIYVATMCGPYPYGFDASGSDPLCPRALAALARNDTCFVDGGSSSPASTPADAASD
jgi:hypothetical protein